MNRVVWIRQGLVGALFLFAGTMKLITPVSVLAMQSPLPGEVLRVIGGFEVLGALVLLLSVLLRIFPEVKSWAALGLTVITAGAVVGTLTIGGQVLVLLLVIGVLIALVAYGRQHVSQTSRGQVAAIGLA
jgi:hypothetical protein